jgi:NAD(P)H-dependent flavin oxidoreductase YrpB (nitropropane dioxygenase family)
VARVEAAARFRGVLMKTPVTEMLQVEYPIFAFSHCRDVVAAVTGAGGFGVLGAVAHTPDQLEADMAGSTSRSTGCLTGLTC